MKTNGAGSLREQKILVDRDYSKDQEEHYDIDGTSQMANSQVVVASEENPDPEKQANLVARIQKWINSQERLH